MKAIFGNAIGPYEDLLTSVKRHKLKWYGHVTRSSGLAKTILQGIVQRGRRRGRQRKRWEDNIKEWTGLEWNIILRKAENHEEWRKLVVKSTVVPQRSARLQDRYDKIRIIVSTHAVISRGIQAALSVAVVVVGLLTAIRLQELTAVVGLLARGVQGPLSSWSVQARLLAVPSAQRLATCVD